MELDEGDIFKTLSSKNFKALKANTDLAVDAGLSSDNQNHHVHENHNIPHYELRSDVLQFTTDDILVGNRADKEIRTFLNPALVGRLLNVHIGPMNVEFSTAVTPPPTPVFERQRRRSSCHVSICASTENNGNNEMSEECSVTSDADINYIM